MENNQTVRYIFKCPDRLPTLSAIDGGYWSMSHIDLIGALVGGAVHMTVIGRFAVCSSLWSEIYRMDPCCTIGDQTFRGPVVICGYHRGELTDVGDEIPEELKRGLYPDGEY